MFGPYPDYWRTDLQWFEYLPESWAILRTKQMFRLVIEKAPANNQMELLSVYTHIGVRPRKSLEQRGNKASSTDGYWVVKEGDIICNKLLAWMGAIGASHYQGVTSPAYDILRPTKSCNTDYYHFLFRTKKYLQQFKIRSRGIMDMRLRLYFDQFGQIPIPVPPRPEQDQIVAYLRVQDAHIARFIKAKRELIKLLTEQKLRIVDHAVTRGLDPSVTLKPSGIEWLGEVPEHWELHRLKFLASNTTNQTTTKASDEIYLALEHVQRWTGVARPLEGEVEFASTVKRFVADDVLFGKLRPYLAKVTRAKCNGVCVSEFLVLRSCKEIILPAYLEQILRCKRVIDLINSSTAGAKMPRADWTFIGNVRLPVPRKDEQEAILSHIEIESKDLDEAIARAEDEIKLIREYRDRLIADVVTGQLDVRSWQSSPDDAALAALGEENEDVTEEEDGDVEE
ncbi:restriction endonuclease subunit S [Edwardsiella tarda]|uniref:restriction endonuclease subunit S n=1 Tax=Edwardsiella tarda TaxID=636 RepID=UPI00351BF22C